MPIRLSGMISGMDTDALVQELVSAYSTKKDNYVKAQTKLEWQMDAWKSLNTKVYGFYSGSLSQMRFSNSYSLKSSTASDSTKAKVSASSSAVNGDQKLKIKALASSGYLTGAELGTDINGEKITTSTKLKDLSGSGFTPGSIINIKVDGKETNIEITEDMNIGQLTGYLKDAGVNANYDENNKRFFISSKTSGEDHDFSLTGNGGGVQVLKDLGVFAVSDADKAQYQEIAAYDDEKLTNLALNDYLKAKIQAANATYTDKIKELQDENSDMQSQLNYANLSDDKKIESYQKIKKDIEATQAEIDALDPDAEDYEAKKTKLEETLSKKNDTLNMYDDVNTRLGISIEEGQDAEGKTTYKVNKGSNYDEKLTSLKDELTENIKNNEEKIKAYNDAASENTALLSKTYSNDEFTGLTITSLEESGSTVSGGISSDYANEEAYKAIYAKYEDLRATANEIVTGKNAAGEDVSGNYASSQAVRLVGKDAEIELNNAKFTSNTNNFSINGLTITATGITADDEEITITTSTDVDGIYDNIKNFFKSYNELEKEMEKLYNADSSKGYEPLTDEEKDAMSDKEVEKWEAKIKDSLLRRDSTLNSVMSAMRTAMSSAFEIDGTAYSLSSFGIKTSGYFAAAENEKGVYHIDGDKEDSTSMGNADKLREMIANNPEAVTEFFSKLSDKLYETLTKKMAASSVSSAYTIYNDKSMKKKYEDYDDTIDEWEEKLEAIEEKYYNQFSAMETAMAKLQSSTSSLSQLMGQ